MNPKIRKIALWGSVTVGVSLCLYVATYFAFRAFHEHRAAADPMLLVLNGGDVYIEKYLAARNKYIIACLLFITLPAATIIFAKISKRLKNESGKLFSFNKVATQLINKFNRSTKGRNIALATLIGAFAIYGYSLNSDYRKKNSAIERVTQSLRDPESARFRDVKIVGDSVCGEVNWKNSFGGYTGFSKFVYINGSVGSTYSPPPPGVLLTPASNVASK